MVEAVLEGKSNGIEPDISMVLPDSLLNFGEVIMMEAGTVLCLST
jgi:hypothetical protein